MNKGDSSKKTTESTPASRGAAPSLPYTLALALPFGVVLIATARFFPPIQAVRVLECDLPKERATMVITVDRRGAQVIARCAYGAK